MVCFCMVLSKSPVQGRERDSEKNPPAPPQRGLQLCYVRLMLHVLGVGSFNSFLTPLLDDAF